MKLKPHEEPLRSEILSGKFTILVSLRGPSCGVFVRPVVVVLCSLLLAPYPEWRDFNSSEQTGNGSAVWRTVSPVIIEIVEDLLYRFRKVASVAHYSHDLWDGTQCVGACLTLWNVGALPLRSQPSRSVCNGWIWWFPCCWFPLVSCLGS